MLSDTVLTALISTAGTVITTIVVAVSGRKTREHVKQVKRDVEKIHEAMYINEEKPVIFGKRDRPVNPQPIKEP